MRREEEKVKSKARIMVAVARESNNKEKEEQKRTEGQRNREGKGPENRIRNPRRGSVSIVEKRAISGKTARNGERVGGYIERPTLEKVTIRGDRGSIPWGKLMIIR